ncbi:MAG: tetratricopeptide repeat protein [candidate division KSB1 bacterium]|nr:tetratricopeptide repeat protein [candidate division KSB1 bacterium]
MALLRFRLCGLGLSVLVCAALLGCAGTRKKEEAAKQPGVEEVLGVEGQQEQAPSEDEVLRLLGITPRGGEAEKTATGQTTVQKSETDILKDRVQELERQLREREAQIASLKADLAAKEKTISDLEARARISAPVAAGARPKAAGEGRAPSSEFRVRYEDALAEYKARNFKAALAIFQELLQTDPNNTLSDNCQYWIGECYYGMEDYNQALVAFEKVFSFPGTNKAADAQLKIGLCYLKLGDRARARQEFQRLIDNYPDSEYVSKARSYLSQL